MHRRWTERLLWLLKWGLFAAIVVGVSRQFARILAAVSWADVAEAGQWGLLVPAAGLYLAAHSCWATFWMHLLRQQGIAIGWYAAWRCYLLSQLGKYVPGKAWVIVLRAGMLRQQLGAHPLPVSLTATYETLTSMGAGALVAVACLPFVGIVPAELSGRWGVLAGVAALPVLLGLLHRLALAYYGRSGRGGEVRTQPPSLPLLAAGLGYGLCGWCLLGVSLHVAIRSLAPAWPAWPAQYPAELGMIALAYVAGFVILVAPGGLGVREWLLLQTLAPALAGMTETPEAVAVMVALMLRLIWTMAEVAVACIVYWIAPAPSASVS